MNIPTWLETLERVERTILSYFDCRHIQGMLANHLEDQWGIEDDEVWFGEVNVEDGFLEGTYSSELRKIYRGEDFTLVVSYAQMGGDCDYQIFDNKKEIKV